jgi:hypothetical protein
MAKSGRAWGDRAASLQGGVGLGCQQDGAQTLGVDDGVGGRSKEEGDGFG